MFSSDLFRDCVHTLHSKDTWLKQARVVRIGEVPYKVRVWLPPVQCLPSEVEALFWFGLFCFCLLSVGRRRFPTCLHVVAAPRICPPAGHTFYPKPSCLFFPLQGCLAELHPFHPLPFQLGNLAPCTIQEPWVTIISNRYWRQKIGISFWCLFFCPRKVWNHWQLVFVVLQVWLLSLHRWWRDIPTRQGRHALQSLQTGTKRTWHCLVAGRQRSTSRL